MQHLLRLMMTVMIASSAFTVVADTITREQSVELMNQCQALRTEKIQMLQEQEMTQCIEEKGQDEAYCRRITQGMGRSYSSNGQYHNGMFWDEPVCVTALKADKYFKAHPAKDSFEP